MLLCGASQVFGLLLWIVCWTDLFYSFHEMQQGQTPPPIFFITPLVLGTTMVSKEKSFQPGSVCLIY